MMHIAPQDYMSEAQQLANRRAIRATFREVTPPLPMIVQERKRYTPPQWTRTTLKFNDHVVSWQMHGARQACSPAIGYLRKRCSELGVELENLVEEGQQRKFAAPRQQLMWELRTVLGMSYPRIGRIFDRDHTTVMHAVRKIEAMRGQG